MMLSKEKLSRLNELARKAKQSTLSPLEKAEQQMLREEYLENFKRGFRDQLEHIHLVDPEKLQ